MSGTNGTPSPQGKHSFEIDDDDINFKEINNDFTMNGDSFVFADNIIDVGDLPGGIIDVGDLPDGIIDVGDLPDGMAMFQDNIIDVGDLPDGIIDIGDLPGGIIDVGDLPDGFTPV